jgi:hypothetical protein
MSKKCVLCSKRKDTYLQSLWNKFAPRSRGLQLTRWEIQSQRNKKAHILLINVILN